MVRKRIVKQRIEQFEMTISELLDEYISNLQVNQCSIHTIETYKTAFKRFISVMGNLQVTEINEKVINNFKLILKNEVSPRTINTYITHLRAVFNYAHKKEYMDNVEIKLVKVQQKEKYVPSKEELELLLTEGKKETYSNYISRISCLIMATTGIRGFELLSLNVSNFYGDYLSTTHTKNKKLRYMPIPKIVSKEITDYIRAYRKDATQDEPLLVSVYGNRYTVKGFRKSLHEYSKKKIGKGIGTHCLRRYFITKSLNNNTNPVILSKITGHSDIRMINYYYNNNLKDLLKIETIDTISDLDLEKSSRKMKNKR